MYLSKDNSTSMSPGMGALATAGKKIADKNFNNFNDKFSF